MIESCVLNEYSGGAGLTFLPGSSMEFFLYKEWTDCKSSSCMLIGLLDPWLHLFLGERWSVARRLSPLLSTGETWTKPHEKKYMTYCMIIAHDVTSLKMQTVPRVFWMVHMTVQTGFV